MENRDVRHEDRRQLDCQPAAAMQPAPTNGSGNSSIGREELRLLIEFFQLLDRWDREEVVQ